MNPPLQNCSKGNGTMGNFVQLKRQRIKSAQCNGMIRLKPHFTENLLHKLVEALGTEKGGVSFVIEQMDMEIVHVYTDTYMHQLYVRAKCNPETYIINSPLKGFNGSHSYIEIATPLSVGEELVKCLKHVIPAP